MIGYNGPSRRVVLKHRVFFVSFSLFALLIYPQIYCKNLIYYSNITGILRDVTYKQDLVYRVVKQVAEHSSLYQNNNCMNVIVRQQLNLRS